MKHRRDGDLPELELLALDEEDPAPSVATVDVHARRWWPVALGAAVVAGAIFVTGHDGSSVAAPPAPTTASTLFAPATSEAPSAQSAAEAARRAYPAVLMSADATALIVLSQGGAFEVDVTKAPDTISGYVARPPATVVTLSNGLVRAYSAQLSQRARSRQCPRGLCISGSSTRVAQWCPQRRRGGQRDAGRRHGAAAARDRLHPVAGGLRGRGRRGESARAVGNRRLGRLWRAADVGSRDACHGLRHAARLAAGSRGRSTRMDAAWLHRVRHLRAPRRHASGHHRGAEPGSDRAGIVLARRAFPRRRDHRQLAGWGERAPSCTLWLSSISTGRARSARRMSRRQTSDRRHQSG